MYSRVSIQLSQQYYLCRFERRHIISNKSHKSEKSFKHRLLTAEASLLLESDMATELDFYNFVRQRFKRQRRILELSTQSWMKRRAMRPTLRVKTILKTAIYSRQRLHEYLVCHVVEYLLLLSLHVDLTLSAKQLGDAGAAHRGADRLHHWSHRSQQAHLK